MRRTPSSYLRSRTKPATWSIASPDPWQKDCTGLPGTCDTPVSPATAATVRWLHRANTPSPAAKRVDDVETAIGAPQSFRVVSVGQPSLPRQDREQTLAFQMQVGELQRAVVGTTRKLQEVLSQLDEIKKGVENTRTLDRRLYDQARALELKFLDVQEQLVGDQTRSRRSQTALVPIMNRVQSALSGTLRQTYGPTKTHRRQYEIGKEQFETTSSRLRELVERDFQNLIDELEKVGAPWTSGRPLPQFK